jgi:hypothetical protein
MVETPKIRSLTAAKAPGAVFTREHGGHQTTWIMVDHGLRSVRYTRVMHGMTARTVAVDVVGSSEHSTRVRVTYDLSAPTERG